MRDVLDQAIRVFGAGSQLNQVAEEAAEMVVAVNHVRRCRTGAIEELIEETADLEIMVEQLRLILGDKAVDAVKVRKIARLRKRIEEKKQCQES